MDRLYSLSRGASCSSLTSCISCTSITSCTSIASCTSITGQILAVEDTHGYTTSTQRVMRHVCILA